MSVTKVYLSLGYESISEPLQVSGVKVPDMVLTTNLFDQSDFPHYFIENDEERGGVSARED